MPHPMHENPSADKFAAPEHTDPVLERWAGSRVARAVLIIGLMVLVQWLHTFKGSGWTKGLAAFGIFVITILHYAFAHRLAARHKRDDPSTPTTHITR